MGRRATDGSWGPRPSGTIWSRSLAREVPPRFRWIYTIFLPIAYGICFLFGTAAAVIIIPTVRVFSSSEFAHLWALLIGLLGLAAFTALAFRLERLEFYVAIALAVALCWYPGILIGSAISGFPEHLERLPSGIGLILLVLIPAGRAVDIIRTARRRIATAELLQVRRPRP